MNGQRLTAEQAAQLLTHGTAAQVHPPAAARGERTLETAPAAAEARVSALASQGGRAFQFDEHQDGSGI